MTDMFEAPAPHIESDRRSINWGEGNRGYRMKFLTKSAQ